MEDTVSKELKALQITIDEKFEEVKEGITSHEDIKSEIGLKVEELETALQVDGKPIIEYVKEMQKSQDTLAAELKTAQSALDLQTKSFTDLLVEGMEENKEALLARGSGKNNNVEFELKTDMISSTSLVNDTTNDARIVPPTRPGGIIFDPDSPVHLRELIPVSPMQGNAVVWPKETTYTDNTDVVAENTASGCSRFILTAQTNLVDTIAAHQVISNLMLEDFPALAAYLQNRLTSKLLLHEDDCILNGTDNVAGLLTVGTAFTANSVTVTDPQHYDVITKAASQLIEDEYYPTGILMNPRDVGNMKLKKDDNNQYIFPFIFIQDGRMVISSVPVYQNTAMTAGTYLMGDFQRGAQLWQRRAITIKFHDCDDTGSVTKDMSTVTISERVALSTYRTTAFVYDTFAASITELTV